MIRVVVADDHPLVRAGLTAIVSGEDDIEVVAEAADGREAAARAREHEADVVLLDLEMAGTGGIAGIALITQARPETRVLVVTTFDLDDYVVAALGAGAAGFVLKTAPTEQLLLAVRQVASGAMVFDPAITSRLVASYVDAATIARLSEDLLAPLTPREREVFELLARARSNAEIANELKLSDPTVKTHVARVLEKLNLRDRTQAVVLAYETGHLTPRSPA